IALVCHLRPFLSLLSLNISILSEWSCWSNLDPSTRIAGGFLFRTLRELNWLKPQKNRSFKMSGFF
ncbi:hypothetical protein ACFW4D_16995, partial [Paenibacillus lactis]|uniref:hypothetical protein n=1 Tax=Paenibacillus lactis TaxID=228574 RepID=UPI003683A64F